MKISEQAATVWAQFARTGDPSVEGLIDWPEYTEENNSYLDIGVPLEAKTGIQDSYVELPPRCDQAYIKNYSQIGYFYQ